MRPGIKSTIATIAFVWTHLVFPLEDKPYSFADSLFLEKDYASAALEYRRASFYTDEPSIKIYGIYKAAESHLYAGEYKKVRETLSILPPSDAETSRALWLHFYAFHQSGEYGDARNFMMDYPEAFSPSPVWSFYPVMTNHAEWDNVEQLRVWMNEAGQEEWNTGGIVRYAYSRNELYEKIKGVYEKNAPLRNKNPVYGALFSVFPGGGQLYAGRYGDATSAFLVNIALAMVTALGVYYEEPGLAAISGTLTFAFYAGNIYGGYRSAKRYNNRNEVLRRKNSEEIFPAYVPLKAE